MESTPQTNVGLAADEAAARAALADAMALNAARSAQAQAYFAHLTQTTASYVQPGGYDATSE